MRSLPLVLSLKRFQGRTFSCSCLNSTLRKSQLATRRTIWMSAPTCATPSVTVLPSQANVSNKKTRRNRSCKTHLLLDPKRPPPNQRKAKMLRVKRQVMKQMRLPSMLKMKSSVKRQKLMHRLRKLPKPRKIKSGLRISQMKKS